MVTASLTPCWSSRPPGARQQGSAQVEKNVTTNSPNYVLTSWMLMSGAEFELAFVTSASSVSRGGAEEGAVGAAEGGAVVG